MDGPYPGIGEVRIYVGSDDLAVARELLLADQVESAFDDDRDDDDEGGGRRGRLAALRVWMTLAVLVLVVATWMARAY